MEGFVGLIKDILFPVFCVSCQAEGEWLCAACLGRVAPFANNQCPLCLAPSAAGSTCAACRSQCHLDGLMAFFNYQEIGSPIPTLIQQFKYNFATDAGLVWKNILAQRPLPLLGNELVLPVPLYARRERERGFNQAARIANFVCETYGLPLDTVSLRRTRATMQQAHLSRHEREQNVKGAFKWIAPKKPLERVVLVDDVYTTGFTMAACAAELKRAGAKQVWGLVLARD